jgi:Domain of unknown function (DUF5925)/ATPase family associated with various cellular activities (AAA)
MTSHIPTITSLPVPPIVLPRPRYDVADSCDETDPCDMRFSGWLLHEGVPHTCAGDWDTSAATLDAVAPGAMATSRWRHGESVLLDLTDDLGAPCLAYVCLWAGRVSYRAGAWEREAARAVEPLLRAALPSFVAPETEEDPHVPVGFWTSDPRQGLTTREMKMPIWDDIAPNYPATVRRRLAPLMAADPSLARAGQLILWHGAPGMGKTTALRALAWQWRSWCRMEYVTDPEALFGGGTDYLMRLLLHGDRDPDVTDQWRLLVLEDTGELMSRDAKQRSGPGLSRMLNLVDGLIGEGLRVLVLATTNEPLGRLHPAVSRSGRSAATIEFDRFTPREAASWLRRRDLAADAPVPVTLAGLFARAAGRETPDDKRPSRVGFVR